jgi:unsaturated chondroitin disaccharide hydrolase
VQPEPWATARPRALSSTRAGSWRTTGDAYYKGVLLTAAASLASRFDATVGAIICCDWNPAWHRPTVVDTMMNLELLLWGVENGGSQSWRAMAVSHALKTLSDMVRPDGSTYHVVDYSPSGVILWRGTLQGFSDASTWTRGQAWAIYGYTMLYRHTADPRMLEAARRVTAYYLGRLGQDAVPAWDFDAPGQQKDSSAAAIVASALFELSGFVGDADRQSYLQAAERMLDALASPAYLAEGSASRSILLHGVGDLPSAHAVDAGLIYGDYYFIEALARRGALPRDLGDAGVPDAGVPDAGVLDAGSDAGAPPVDAGQPAGSPQTTPLPQAPAAGCATGSGGTLTFLAALLLVCLIRRRRGTCQRRPPVDSESMPRRGTRSRTAAGRSRSPRCRRANTRRRCGTRARACRRYSRSR